MQAPVAPVVFCLPCGCGRPSQRYCSGSPGNKKKRDLCRRIKILEIFFSDFHFNTLPSPLPRISPGPPRHRSCSTPSAPVCPADGTYTAPPPGAGGEKEERRSDREQWGSREESLMGAHLILQLVLPVHFVLSDIEVVGGVIVHGLDEAEDERTRRLGSWTPWMTWSSRTRTSRWAVVWLRPVTLTAHSIDMAPVGGVAVAMAAGRAGAEHHRDAGCSFPGSTYAGSWCLSGCSCPHSRPCPWSEAPTLQEPPPGPPVCEPPAAGCWTALGPACPGWGPRRGGTAPSHSTGRDKI